MSTTADDPALETAARTTPAPSPSSSSAADRFMRRLLRLPEGKTSTAAEARSAFQKSVLISAARCTFMYIVFPFVLPAIGLARGIGPYLGLPIGVLAIVSIIYSIRRFWRADHSKRWHYTFFGSAIIVLLIVLGIQDLTAIIS